MIGRLRQLSEPRLRQQSRTEKSQIAVERNILVQWVRNWKISMFSALICHIYLVIRQELILPKYLHCADMLASLVKYHNIYYYKIYNYKIAIKWVVLFQNSPKDVDLGLSRVGRKILRNRLN